MIEPAIVRRVGFPQPALTARIAPSLVAFTVGLHVGTQTPSAGNATAVDPQVESQAASPRIAVTIDDLPWNGPLAVDDREAATARLLDALTRHHVLATGFVRCADVSPDAPLLRLWLERGMELGNHSQSHRDLNDASLDKWLVDVRACDVLLREVIGKAVRYFRYPYLHQGPTPERQQAALDLLRELDYEIAHVTVDNSEWVLSRPYERAIGEGDSLAAQRIGKLLIAHVVDAVRHAQQVARLKVGRDVDHVLLLHATLLVSDQMDTLLDSLSAQGFRFVPLDDALQDPIYRRSDDYTGRSGLSWLYRMEPATPEDARWDAEQERRLQALIGASR